MRQATVSYDPGEHDLALARRLRDRGGARIALPRLSIDVASPVIAELCEHPGAEDKAESGMTEDDLGVRVCFKRALQLVLECDELCVHLGQDPHADLDG